MSERLAFRRLRLLAQIRVLWRRATRALADVLPKGLYKRSLLIVILPMVLLQSAVTFVFMQHHWDLVHRIHPYDQGRQKQWRLLHKTKRDEGKIEELVQLRRSIEAPTADLAEKITTEAAYFEKNADRMRYPEFRRQHLFVGSGVIEAACKTVIGARLKQSDMFWTVDNANAIIGLRCCQLNNRMEDYWENRRAS